MRTNPSWKDWFVFPKKERNILFVLLFAFASYCFFLAFYNPELKPVVIENLDEKLASLSSHADDTSDSLSGDAMLAETSDEGETKSTQHLFFFDPNTLDASGFQQLGLRDKTIHTLLNYRNKGGHFYKAENLRKIYGITEEEADKIIPFVKINPVKDTEKYVAGNKDTQAFYVKGKPKVIDINNATVEEWKALPAIGETLSNRIVKYRDKIGGFTSVEQVKQTYGLSDSAYRVILPYLHLSSGQTVAKSTSPVTQSTAPSSSKININKATGSELKSIAVIPPDVADAIIIYRKQHGNYSSVEDIKKIVFINEEVYQKISPYLTVE